MSSYSRRRFLSDLLFVGGAIAAAAGLALTGESAEAPSPTPALTPKATSTCALPKPGERVAEPVIPSPGVVVPVTPATPNPPVAPSGAPPVRPPQKPPKKGNKKP